MAVSCGWATMDLERRRVTVLFRCFSRHFNVVRDGCFLGWDYVGATRGGVHWLMVVFPVVVMLFGGWGLRECRHVAAMWRRRVVQYW